MLNHITKYKKSLSVFKNKSGPHYERKRINGTKQNFHVFVFIRYFVSMDTGMYYASQYVVYDTTI